jgi:hypothetical protein
MRLRSPPGSRRPRADNRWVLESPNRPACNRSPSVVPPGPRGPDDVYRLRACETTARIPRFNNTASQVTILLLQNPSGRTVTGTLSFWRGDGQLATSALVSLPPRSTALTNTAALVPGQGGSITLSHDGPYGVVQGKAVSLEPSTGFSFDTPLEYRPR